MERYDEGYLQGTEKKIEQLHECALQKVRQTFPMASLVIDRRTLDDYSDKIWDYPGQWYICFKLPKGFDSEEALIDQIAADTLEYYQQQEQKQ